MTEKSDLLGQLKIDRNNDDARGISTRSVIVISLAAAAIAAIIAVQFTSGPSAPDENSATVEASPETATPSNLPAEGAAIAATSSSEDEATATPDERILNASGYITARRMATVSSKIMGLITEILVEEGMEVSAGQVLARLDDSVALVDLRLAEAQVGVQKARLQGFEANLAEAERVLSRATALKDEDFSSEASVTRAQAQVDSLKATLASSVAEIAVAELGVARQRERLSDYVIRAPFSGVVTLKNAQPGEIVSPSSAGGGFTRTGICTIVDMDSLEIEVDVNEAFIGRVFAGQRVRANLDAYPDWEIPASVIAIIPTADRARATVRVRIRIETKDARILPDMGVRVAFLKI